MRQRIMQKTFEPVIENIYSHNQPMPVVSVTEIKISLEKSSIYVGTIELINSGEGVLMGFIESVNDWVSIKDKELSGNHQVITYQVDAGNLQAGELVEDNLVITYNGGEISLPIFIQVMAINEVHKGIILKPKKNIQAVDFSLNKRSYHVDEIGYLTINNYHNRRIVVRLISEDPIIVYKNKVLEITDSEKVEFSFKVSKLDRMLGKVPLKTNPKIEMNLLFEVEVGAKRAIYSKTAYLTELSGYPADDKIASERNYRIFSAKMIRKYQEMVLVNNDHNLFVFQKDIESALVYDQTNIELRLIHLFLNVQKGKKKAALEEVNQIEHYLLYYDHQNSDVSDLLMLFLELLKGEHVEDLIRNWKPKAKENWLKTLMKNRILTIRGNAYEEYKTLYELGIKNTLLFIEATDFLNHNPMVPTESDQFYIGVLRWAIRHQFLGLKWLRKIESSSYVFNRDFPMKMDIAEKLYELNTSKNMLILLCNSYMAHRRLDLQALQLYTQVITERIHINEIDTFYIMASYQCKCALKSDVLKTMYKISELDGPFRSYYLLHVRIFRLTLRAQYHVLEKEILAMNTTNLPLEIVLEVEEKEIYLQYLMETNQVELIIQLNGKDYFEEVSKSVLLDMIGFISKKYPDVGAKMGLTAFKKKGIYNQATLKLIAPNIKGDLSELLHFYQLLNENLVFNEALEEQILYKGIISRKYSEEIIRIFISYCKKAEHASNHKWLLQYLVRQILIEDFEPSEEMLGLLERDFEKEKKLLTGLSIIKGSIHLGKRNDKLIHQLISEYIHEDILLPWFELLVPKEVLGEKWRFMECFEYYSIPTSQVLFYYRLEDDQDYHVLKMKQVGLGLFSVHVVLFFNERIQYYIKEIGEDQKEDVRLSDIYCSESSEEQLDAESLYDRINTIEMSKSLDDSESLKQTIEDYFDLCKKEIGQIEIL